jgi:hypothetical protein
MALTPLRSAEASRGIGTENIYFESWDDASMASFQSPKGKPRCSIDLIYWEEGMPWGLMLNGRGVGQKCWIHRYIKKYHYGETPWEVPWR